MIQGVEVRVRRPADLPQCTDLLVAVHEESQYPVFLPPEPAGWLATPNTVDAWVAVDRQQVVGHVALHRAAGPALPLWQRATSLAPHRLGVVARLFVAPGTRRSGVGRLLVDAASDEAVRRNLHPVLDVLTRYPGPQRLYDAMGWQVAGAFDWHMPEGTIEPSLAYVAPGDVPSADPHAPQ